MKLKAKGREKSHRINFFLVEGLIVALGKFCASPVILRRKMQLAFVVTCFAKYDFPVDVFVVQIERTIKITREFITKQVGIALAKVILELQGSFTLERHLVICLAETFVKACPCLISRVVYNLSVRRGLFQR